MWLFKDITDFSRMESQIIRLSDPQLTLGEDERLRFHTVSEGDGVCDLTDSQSGCV